MPEIINLHNIKNTEVVRTLKENYSSNILVFMD